MLTVIVLYPSVAMLDSRGLHLLKQIRESLRGGPVSLYAHLPDVQPHVPWDEEEYEEILQQLCDEGYVRADCSRRFAYITLSGQRALGQVTSSPQWAQRPPQTRPSFRETERDAAGLLARLREEHGPEDRVTIWDVMDAGYSHQDAAVLVQALAEDGRIVVILDDMNNVPITFVLATDAP